MGRYKGYKDLSGRYWSALKYNAKKRGIPFCKDFTIKDAWDIFEKQNKKCALSKVDIHLYPAKKDLNTASLDRIDSSIGYCINNVQWLHKDINTLKNTMSNSEVRKICKNIYLEGLKDDRPDWPEYFIQMAYIISTRSKDPSTKIGSVITDENYRIISTGYNGSFQGIDDDSVSWERPEKYEHITHAEMNAVLFARESLKGAIVFNTCIPCSNCCKHLLQAGVSKIYYGNTTAKICNEEDMNIVRKLCKIKNVKLIHVDI